MKLWVFRFVKVMIEKDNLKGEINELDMVAARQ